MHVVRQPRAEDADFAGAGDVDQIGLEPLKGTSPMSGMWRRNAGSKRRSFSRGEGKKAARQLKGPDVAVFDQGLGAVSGAHAKKGKIAPARKGLKVAAGVGNPVDLVERVGKVRDARRGSEHKSSGIRGTDGVSGGRANAFANSAGAAHRASSAALP